jgi:hypothetical protein
VLTSLSPSTNFSEGDIDSDSHPGVNPEIADDQSSVAASPQPFLDKAPTIRRIGRIIRHSLQSFANTEDV